MGTIADKLNRLLNTKAAIKAAIIGKGQPVADEDPFSTYPAKIEAIETGIQLPALTTPGAAADLLAGKQLIDQDGNPLTGTMPEVEQATPGISVDASGLITASAAQSEGKVAAGTKSATSQLATQAGTTITPGTAEKTAVAAGRYTTGDVKVAGDANLTAINIPIGYSYFGIAGCGKGCCCGKFYATSNTSASFDIAKWSASSLAGNARVRAIFILEGSDVVLSAFTTSSLSVGGTMYFTLINAGYTSINNYCKVSATNVAITIGDTADFTFRTSVEYKFVVIYDGVGDYSDLA